MIAFSALAVTNVLYFALDQLTKISQTVMVHCSRIKCMYKQVVFISKRKIVIL